MIIYLDTETTGLRPGNICQLSYIMQSKGDVIARNMFFTVDSVEAGAYAVHGFSVPKLKELSNGKRFSDRIEEIENDFSIADVLVSHNTAFDFMFLRSEFYNSGRVFSPNSEFCSMKGSVPICKIPKSYGYGYKYPKLSELCSYFGISNEEILTFEKQLFGADCTFHDARFDTTALFLSVNKGIECGYYEKLKSKL